MNHSKTWQQGRIRGGLVLLFIAVLIGAAAYDADQRLHAPLNLRQAVTIEIKPGQRLEDALSGLHQQSIISVRQAAYLKAYARLSGAARHIQSGQYRFMPGTNALTVLDDLVKGKVLMHQLSLIEGWRFRQAWQVISKAPNLRHTLPADAGSKQIMAAIGHPGVAAEGEFFPDTYRFPKGETDVQFLRRAYREMQRRLQVVWAARAKNLPIKTPYDALIMASLIEKETAQPKERGEIAGVFMRRLRIGMRLQTDPSVIYGMGSKYKGDITLKDLRQDTPYNTYTRAGLPPTPICLPGEASLRAAVHPTPGKALYFVSKGDGTHVFADTLAQQNANVRKYQLGGK